jgi:hypothetical protein
LHSGNPERAAIDELALVCIAPPLVQSAERYVKCNHTTHATPVSSTDAAHFFQFVKDRTARLAKNQNQINHGNTAIRLIMISSGQ